ncbi:hypothetical protein AB0B28_09980 [Glycomyces sp. NPDC046736]
MEFLPFFFAALGFYILYWVVRYAVRHALQDADDRRNRLDPNRDGA